MNDPGLDEPIEDASNQVKENVDASHQHSAEENMDEEQEERNFLMPARWWYASTGFPLIAGTFGPMANAFSICALVENWRVAIPPGGTEEHGIDIKDPSWLIAVNAVSLVCALVANLSLLLNMARRVPFKIAQPVTIIGFCLASVLLISLIAVASHDFHAPGVKNQALTQAYYYATFAAGLYMIISLLMCVTVYGAYKRHYSREFKLTIAQRTLMLQTIVFLVYLLLGALVYSKIEEWKFLDAVYWADFTLLTIGIGDDYVPRTHLGRGLLFPFAMGGIIILGLVVGSIRSLILDRGKKKMASRLTEKTRARLVKDMERLVEKKGRLRHKMMGLGKDTTNALMLGPGDGNIAELDRREAEFEAMRRVQGRAATQRKYMSLGISTFAFAFLWTIGALVFYSAERNQDWSYFESLYFAYTTLLTLGYGDFQPASNSGKPFLVFWSLLAVPTLTILISNMGDTVVKSIKDVTIWFGEVTVLPSDEGSTTDRLKHGIYKATMGRIDARAANSPDVEEADDNDSESGYQEMHPGLTRAFRGRNEGHSRRQDRATKDRLVADFARSERIDEDIARGHGDRLAEDEHHYRGLLVSQIRKVYADTTASHPKHYSYAEWVYFLKLLGEDEEDESFHKSALSRADPERRSADTVTREKDFQISGQEGAYASGGKESNKKGGKVRWSWIGNRSPLMGDEDEAEWLLQKFFERLEESLQGEEQEKEKGIKKDQQDRTRRERTGGKEDDHGGSGDEAVDKDQPSGVQDVQRKLDEHHHN